MGESECGPYTTRSQPGKTHVMPLLQEPDPSLPHLDSTLHGALHGAAGYQKGQYILEDTSHSPSELNCEPHCAAHMYPHKKAGRRGKE